ncbi:MAG: efflux RND transporter permease subunit [Pseudomonadota bacterium]
MTGIVDWASDRARMIFVFVVLSIAAGAVSYFGLPKEGEPDIDVPVLFVSVPFPGISAQDAEKLLIKPMEAELQGIDGLKDMTASANEGFAFVALEFEFGWDKGATLADVREKVSNAEADFPDGAEQYTIDELNFSAFPILVVSLSGDVPERTLSRIAKNLQDDLESIPAVLEAGLAGHRDEMVEVIIDPLKLEAYNVTADDLVSAVVNNNQLIAAGDIETPTGTFAVKIPSSFDDVQDIYALPIKVNGDSVVTLGQLASINLTFEDREGTARFNGNKTIALQIVKRKGFNHLETVTEVRSTVDAAVALWPDELRDAVQVDYGLDQSVQVTSMIQQLEGAVLTAVLLVMIVVLAALGMRSALLVGFAIPSSFLISFVGMAIAGITISNIVMFGLILAVGMLVDGAIVVVEYADKQVKKGVGPMKAYGAAAKRMFWPIISSTATTLCAFLPMLFWPGIPGEFMGNLPVTLIYVLSASLLVALVYLPVIGGIAGRISRTLGVWADQLRVSLAPIWRVSLFVLIIVMLFGFGLGVLRGGVFAMILFTLAAVTLSVVASSLRKPTPEDGVISGFQETKVGRAVRFMVGNPYMPFVTIAAVLAFVVGTFIYYGSNNYGVEFFVETEPENAVVYVRARGNLSLEEQDALVKQVENRVLQVEGIKSAFSFAGDGGLNNNTGGAEPPLDTIGQVQIELASWEIRGAGTGQGIIDEIDAIIKGIPGINSEILVISTGPASGKPLFLRVTGESLDTLEDTTLKIREKFDATPGLTLVEDTTPLPGIDWQIDVDVEQAGRYDANVAVVGAMVQLVTRGLFLDNMRLDSSDDEIEIRVRVPEEDRLLSTLDTLKVRTELGLVPLSNFVTRTPVRSLAKIDRSNTERYYDVKADVLPGVVKIEANDPEVPETYLQSISGAGVEEGDVVFEDSSYIILETAAQNIDAVQSVLDEGGTSLEIVNANERILELTDWLTNEADLPVENSWRWEGDQEDQAESAEFLPRAFGVALALMFVILLAQFNSFYNAVLVLFAVILSSAGVLWGMVIREQTFSIIMTGTGIVALAGIVVNNNIVLIDTYQEYTRVMPRIQAIIRAVQDRMRPVLLTTLTTMAGLTPMMFAVSINFNFNSAAPAFTIGAPTALWWVQLATAVVWGLGMATILTLVFTPSALAARVYIGDALRNATASTRASWLGHRSQAFRDYQQAKKASETRPAQIDWTEEHKPKSIDDKLQAAE